MKAWPIKTHLIQSGESLEKVLDLYIPAPKEQSVVAITSKIISVCQGRLVARDGCNKRELIHAEADAVVVAAANPYELYLTVKNDILIPSAGIDESNGDDVYILYPEKIQETAAAIWNYLRAKHKVEHLGVIITDSHTTPMRRGVTGISLGWCGFKPLYSYIGKPDIYQKPLKVTQINLLDALATSAVLMMGEGDEMTPMALIQDAPKIEFVTRIPTAEEEKSVVIPMEEDIYAPLLMSATWKRK